MACLASSKEMEMHMWSTWGEEDHGWLLDHFEPAPALSVYVIMLFLKNDGIESPLCRIAVGYCLEEDGNEIDRKHGFLHGGECRHGNIIILRTHK